MGTPLDGEFPGSRPLEGEISSATEDPLGQMPTAWSIVEVHAIVADYIAMLQLELRGETYNKAAHNRALMEQLNDRSHGSIERKHQNISAILIELGYPYIEGYKPLFNYQALLEEVVTERVLGSAELGQAVALAVDAPASSPELIDLLGRLEAPPKPRETILGPTMEPGGSRGRAGSKVNYLAREHRNASLGLAGEKFVVEFERARLRREQKPSLAERVEHVAETQGDGLGFDVRSFDLDGKDRLIEVKTTAYGKETPFFLSRNEVAFSRSRSDDYHLYRVFRFRHNPRLFTLRGAMEAVCRLEPIQYQAQVR